MSELHEKEATDYRHDSNDGIEALDAGDKQLIRRIDWHLLPWICILYALSLVDRYILSSIFFLTSRVNIGVARVAGMATELNMTSANAAYSIALLVFFPGYSILLTEY